MVSANSQTTKQLSRLLEISITSMLAADPSELISPTRTLFLKVKQQSAESSLMVAKHAHSGANVRMPKGKGRRIPMVPRKEPRFFAISLKVFLFP